MESLKAFKNHALLARETKNSQAKGKKKGKENTNNDFNPKDKKNPSEGASGSKKENNKNFDKAKFSYWKIGNHPKNLCIKKTIDQMSRLLEHVTPLFRPPIALNDI